MREIELSSISEFQMGNAQNDKAGTGCTVILSPNGATTGVDVRGGAPGTRETDLLRPENLVDQVHAVLLSGGSAFGLDAAAGVASFLEEKQIGFPAGPAKVPIVSGAVLFDLAIGDASVRPDKEMGYSAAEAAWTEEEFVEGNAGCGTGATVGKCRGTDFSMKGGIGVCAVQAGDLKIGAIVAVNAFGDIIDPSVNKIVAGAYNRKEKKLIDSERYLFREEREQSIDEYGTNTTIGAVITNARLTKANASKIASMAHDGLARTTRPSHTLYDGDTLFVMGSGEVEADINRTGILSAYVVEKAVIRAATTAKSAYGIPGARSLQKNDE